MGFNTVAMFLNDRSDVLDSRSEEVVDTLKECLRGGQGTDGSGGPGQMQVLPSCHADDVQVVIAGGNSLRLLGFAHWRDDPEAIIRKLAEQHGFRLVRKVRSSATIYETEVAEIARRLNPAERAALLTLPLPADADPIRWKAARPYSSLWRKSSAHWDAMLTLEARAIVERKVSRGETLWRPTKPLGLALVAHLLNGAGPHG